MKDLMIDIETMGITSDAVMIQLAAVYFDPFTKEIGKKFNIYISEDSCLSSGFITDQSTKDWWSKQNQNVLQNIQSQSIDVKNAMEGFVNFLPKNTYDLRVWSHATFDFVIVQNYLQKLTKKRFNHKTAMDIRTLIYLSGIDLDSYDWSQKTHDALDDCLFQINYCSDAIQKIKAE
jgi:exodeoxyribonuclease VIII